MSQIRGLVVVVTASALLAFSLHSQGVRNVTPPTFADMLRSSTGGDVTVTTGGETLTGKLALVSLDYITIAVPDANPEGTDIQIPMASIDYTSRRGHDRQISIVLR